MVQLDMALFESWLGGRLGLYLRGRKWQVW
jgi:hypothetical protein